MKSKMGKRLLAATSVFGAVAVTLAGSGSLAHGQTSGNGPITITMWDNFTDPSSSIVFTTVIKNFEKLHPNIHVQRVAMQFTNMRDTIKPALLSGKGPDVFYYDSGPGYMGLLAKDGLLLNLTSFAKQNGWNQRFPQWVLHNSSMNGQVYGAGSEEEVLGVFYNKAIFKQLGVSVPTTYQQFLHIAQLAKERQITPIEIDDKDQWPGFHFESMFYTAAAGKDVVQSVLDEKNKNGFNQPIFVSALSRFLSLIKNGYTNPSPLAVSYDDANRVFESGKAAMRFTGSWMVGEYAKSMGSNVGFFVLPSVNPKLPTMAPGDIGGIMLISKKTKYAPAAEQFVDYMYSKATAKIWLEHSLITPISYNVDSIPGLSPLFKQVVNVVHGRRGLSYSLDVLMPQTVNTVTQNAFQQLIAGQLTPQAYVQQKQQAFAQAISDGEYFH